MPSTKAATSRFKAHSRPAAKSKAATAKPKTSGKPASKVSGKKSPAPKKPAPKAAPRPAAKAAPKSPPKPAPKPAVKATIKPAAKPAGKPSGKPSAVAAAPQGKASKGVTVVQPAAPSAAKKPKPKLSPLPPGVGGLMDKLGHHRKPLIPSGPKASPAVPLGAHNVPVHEEPRPEIKTPFNHAELERFRAILLRKRAELVGDVSTMENEALKGESGSLSSLPQHIAEQGSEAYEQSLSLDLAAADRKLIKEIDDAIKRIDNGTFGVCELTGKPIKIERLEELPWARYSIEAARELERRSMRS